MNKSGKKANQRNWVKTLKIVVIIILAITLVLLCTAFAFLYSKYRLINKAEVDEEVVTNPYIDETVKEVMKGYTTFAIFGIDARNNTNLGKGTLSDVIMICNINNETGEIRLASIYRDTYLDINGKDDYRKINAAYLVGGPEQALMALNQNLDFNITKYVTFNWKSVADVINILGGIDVEITKQEYGNGTNTGINGFIQATSQATGIPSTHLPGPGLQHLDGVQAVAYSRLRLMDTDFQRTKRQHTVITLSLEKAKQADIGMLVDSIDAVFPYILTNFSMMEMVRMVTNIPDYHIGDTTGFPTVFTSKRMGRQGLCLVPKDLSNNVAELHHFLFENEEYQVSDEILRRDKVIRDKLNASGTTTTTTAATKTTAPPTTSASTTAPQTSAPVTSGAETSVPETSIPETSVPIITLPETTGPETSLPETSPAETLPITTLPITTLPAESTTAPVTTSPAASEGTIPPASLPAVNNNAESSSFHNNSGIWLIP